MKSSKIAFLAITAVGFVYCSPAEAAIRNYTNNYKGVYTGISSLLDTFRQLGTPIKVEKAGKGYKYRFEKVDVTFGGKEDARVNTIIIDKDYQYIDPNGFKLGDRIAAVKARVEGEYGGKTIIDYNNGIVYWHDGEVIKIIVLGDALVKDDSKLSSVPKKPKTQRQIVYKIKNKDGSVLYTNNPGTQAAVPIKTKPLETIHLKEVTGYVIHLKNGRTEKVKKASSDGSKVWFKTGPIETVMPIGEIRGVEELSRTGEEACSQYLDFRAGF